ncbi:hypothetical protein [Nostoc sp.]
MSRCNTNITLGVQFVAQNTVWGMGGAEGRGQGAGEAGEAGEEFLTFD